mmetsp:Transcript_29754/g.54869  ORF Transcript_29754/g.54869 Transcript_29754/m.54869 type:complete len:211 (-) Transcript_29754:272-904(-)
MILCFLFSLLLLASPYVAAFSPVAHFAAAPSTSTSISTLYMSLKELDDSNMMDLLFQPSEGKAVLVDACAPWCGPCKLIEPYLDECAKKYSDQLSVVKYDVEGGNNKNLKVEMLLQGVMVRGLPTLLLYNNGIPLASHSGVITETGLEEWLEDNLLSKMDEFETEVTQSTAVTSKEKEESKKDEVNEGDTGSKRGSVSLASQLGKDDYML